MISCPSLSGNGAICRENKTVIYLNSYADGHDKADQIVEPMIYNPHDSPTKGPSPCNPTTSGLFRTIRVRGSDQVPLQFPYGLPFECIEGRDSNV
jgi:hypothetical protein